MGILSFFKKKKKSNVIHKFYAVFATTEKIDTDYHFLSTYINNYLYPDLEMVFFSSSKLREYIAGRVLPKNGNPKMYIYETIIGTISEECSEYIRNHVDTDEPIDLSYFKENFHGFFEFSREFMDAELIKGILPGIETWDEFSMCLEQGYDHLLENTLKRKYYGYIHSYNNEQLEKAVSDGIRQLSLRVVIDIFDAFRDREENWIDDFCKTVYDTIYNTLKYRGEKIRENF